MECWFSACNAYSVSPAFLVFKLVFYVLERDRFHFFMVQNKVYVVTEGTSKVAAWKKKNRRNFTIPIHETDIKEPFYIQLLTTF